MIMKRSGAEILYPGGASSRLGRGRLASQDVHCQDLRRQGHERLDQLPVAAAADRAEARVQEAFWIGEAAKPARDVIRDRVRS